MSANKPKIAFFDFAGCEGCQLTVLDALQDAPELLNVVDIVQFREAISEQGVDYQIAFVEGSCTRSADEARLQAIRAQARTVVALGACAHQAGVNAIRNRQRFDDVVRVVYGEAGKRYENYAARPIGAVIPVDGFIPGCPIDRGEFVGAVKSLLLGRPLRIPDYPVCVECKLKENACVIRQGQSCLGAITRAGCGARCPTCGAGCEGCRGLVPEPNLAWLKAAMADCGIAEDAFAGTVGLFLSYQLAANEEGGNGHR